MTFSQIYRAFKREFGHRVWYDGIVIKPTYTRFLIVNEQLLVQNYILSLTDSSIKYQVDLLFPDEEIYMEPGVAGPKEFTFQFNRDTYWINAPDLKKRQIKVRCSCPDFSYTFAYADWKAGCYIGAKPPLRLSSFPKTVLYRRKARIKNPRGVPGICKHVYGVLKYLGNKKYVQ